MLPAITHPTTRSQEGNGGRRPMPPARLADSIAPEPSCSGLLPHQEAGARGKAH